MYFCRVLLQRPRQRQFGYTFSTLRTHECIVSTHNYTWSEFPIPRILHLLSTLLQLLILFSIFHSHSWFLDFCVATHVRVCVFSVCAWLCLCHCVAHCEKFDSPFLVVLFLVWCKHLVQFFRYCCWCPVLLLWCPPPIQHNKIFIIFPLFFIFYRISENSKTK